MSDVVDLILADHVELKAVFEKLKAGDAGARGLLVPVAASMLVAHSRAEESEVYPVVRDEANDAEDVEHSQEEHAAAEQLLEELRHHLGLELSDLVFRKTRLGGDLVDELEEGPKLRAEGDHTP